MSFAAFQRSVRQHEHRRARPERPPSQNSMKKELPEFRLRLQVKAGLTGYAQVYGKYNTTPYDKLLMDLMYIARPGDPAGSVHSVCHGKNSLQSGKHGGRGRRTDDGVGRGNRERREGKMKVLITGAGGMVGSHMAERLAAEGCETLGTYYRPSVSLTELDPEIPLIECDVRYPQSVEKILTDFRPDWIFHLAAQSYPSVSWERPYETLETNIGGTAAVFEGVKAVRRMSDASYDPMVVVACSSAEYGESFQLSGGRPGAGGCASASSSSVRSQQGGAGPAGVSVFPERQESGA